MANGSKHGGFIRLEDLESVNKKIISEIRSISEAFPIKSTVSNLLDLKSYDYLFKELVLDSENLLDNTPEVIQALKDLGAAMKESADTVEGDSGIPAAYTYLGQFIDHDITLEAASDDIANASFNSIFFNPIPPSELRNKLKNTRSGSFDLDSVYDEEKASRVNNRFKIGKVSPAGKRPRNKIDENDLPRKDNPQRVAEIGDARNDENTIIAQLHVAFLKFHNAIMDKQGLDFEQAKKKVRQHYQWIVIHDFLNKICDKDIVDTVLAQGNKIYNPGDDDFFMPVEFSAAIYRFGHSMVRTSYNFNEFFNSHETPATLDLLFKFTGLSGDMAGLPTLPENWIIEWENILPFGQNLNVKARKINTRLTVGLQHLTGPGNDGIFQFLAKRNLLRGYLLSLPTGQALARKIFGENGVLTPKQILNNATQEEKNALLSAGLHIKTPLWYYVLAEASIEERGRKLGKLGSLIIAETIIGLIRRSEDSILQGDNWKPSLGENFDLEQMIQFANLGPGQTEI